jgi:hypothetical protein
MTADIPPGASFRLPRLNEAAGAADASRAMQGSALNFDFRFSLIFLSDAKSIGCKQKGFNSHGR